MIPFGSQRASGQDLATHLLNARDNERVELAEVRGAVADDLHGAFAEWEAQAHALTRCSQYLYSLSVNPDPAQEPLTRDQYRDYIDRVEEKLGLTAQPRAVVFHEKYGRGHCHVVWSRIDTDKEKAVQMAFDHDKLMMVTREFARDHGLTLPRGYFREEKGPQLSLYELHRQRVTGLSKGDHKSQVTGAWRESDSPKAFTQALAARGYILATGNRPYVLVDLYGGMHALPRLIDDKTVRTKDIRAFLERDYPPASLPDVDQARALVAGHSKALEKHCMAEARAEELSQLQARQQQRRQDLESRQVALRQKQHRERLALSRQQRERREALRRAHRSKMQQIRRGWAQRRPRGLAAFLGRVSGVELARRKLEKFRDRQRHRAYLAAQAALKTDQREERQWLARRQRLQRADLARKLRALARLDKRERRSLEEAFARGERTEGRGGDTRMPALPPELLDQARVAGSRRAREAAAPAREDFNKAGGSDKEKPPRDSFDRAAGGAAATDKRESAPKQKVRRYGPKKDKDRNNDRGR
ncbi:MAG: relaxase [Spiribacter salinus]|uniref:Relaxase n=1 Tax=Spiribacter salinus TaxID=1335746 RepID=A0A540VS62_9GAMM|nr:MAG: relaxase [Spiribacter salinus]